MLLQFSPSSSIQKFVGLTFLDPWSLLVASLGSILSSVFHNWTSKKVTHLGSANVLGTPKLATWDKNILTVLRSVLQICNFSMTIVVSGGQNTNKNKSYTCKKKQNMRKIGNPTIVECLDCWCLLLEMMFQLCIGYLH